MSEELVQLVEKGYEAWNSGDRSWVLDHMSPEVEWITPEDDPDPGTYHGYEGVEHYWAQWRAAVGQLNFKIEEMIDAGQSVVVVARRQGKGRAQRPRDLRPGDPGLRLRGRELRSRARVLRPERGARRRARRPHQCRLLS